jgi:hypothetical protein
MTIHIPKPIAIPLLAGLIAAFVAVLAKEAPDLWRYAKFEGM